MKEQSNKILLAFYGDDFTGSTDALEFLSRAGAKTVLFIEPPTPEKLASYPGIEAIGVAGITRSMNPQEMEQVLTSAFTSLKQLGARHIHYKVCSTFDSSPTIGSIGKAIDIGAEIFASSFVPLLVAAPALGRYCVFGNLFARMGIGSNGVIYRLDRHPSMSRHPVTPSHESDLRLHLTKQTSRTIGLMDILQVVQEHEKGKTILQSVIDDGNEIVLFDALYEEQLEGIGLLIDAYANDNSSLFSVGSSGIEMALGSMWQSQELLTPRQSWPEAGKAEPLLIVSGSCSLTNSRQITRALSQGFVEVGLDTGFIATNGNTAAVIEKHVSQVVDFINEGYNVIVHTSRGNDDERLLNANEVFSAKGFTQTEISQLTSKLFGAALGQIALGVAARTKLQRIVIAGGDTSGYAVREMGIEAVEVMALHSPGAPICKAHAPGSPLDGLEVIIKGGQVGGEDYFETVVEGKYNFTNTIEM